MSFAEAHAYATIESDTIDVPVRTSEALLREYSEIAERDGKPSAKDAKNKTPTSDDDDELAEIKGPLSRLIENARPDQRAILVQLSAKLGLGPLATIADVQEKFNQLEDKLDTADRKVDAATRARRSALRKVREEIYAIWPELRAEYAPLAIELVTKRADEFVERIQKLPDYPTLKEASKKEDDLAKASMKIEREKARAERLLRTCENAVLAENLPRVATPEIVKRYEQLLAMENETLADSSQPVNHPAVKSTARDGN